MPNRTFTPQPHDRADVINQLRRKIGTRPVYVVQRHVSDSGMLRRLSLFAVVNGELENITWDAAVAMNERVTEHQGHFTLTARGAGMDMHFDTVYRLSHALRGDGYAIKHRTI